MRSRDAKPRGLVSGKTREIARLPKANRDVRNPPWAFRRSMFYGDLLFDAAVKLIPNFPFHIPKFYTRPRL